MILILKFKSVLYHSPNQIIASMKKIIYTIALCATTFCLHPLLAQDVDVLIIDEAEETTPVTFSGSVDTYFRYNLNSANRTDDGDIRAPGTSFADLPGFALGMVNLIAGYEGEKVGFVSDLVFGPRGEAAVFNSVGSSAIINQLYVYWKANDAVTLTLGNFNTFLGYEVISPVGNFNYSTSYMFSYGPFSHTGLKADFALSDEFSLMLAIMNPTDFTEYNQVGSYTLGGQLGYSDDVASVYLNLLYGNQDGKLDADRPGLVGTSEGFDLGNTFQADVTAGFDISDEFYLGVNATINTTAPGEVIEEGGTIDIDGDNAGFYGAAVYLQNSFSEDFALGLRGEYFSIFNKAATPFGLNEEGDGSVIDLTLSGNIKVAQGLTIIPEIRVDITSEDSFDNRNLEEQLQGSLASFLLAAVYAF